MKKFIIILLSVFAILFLFGCSLRYESEAGSPETLDPMSIDFQRITTAQVERVYIVYHHSFYHNPTKWAELTYDDMDSLTALLNQVELIGEPSDKFTDKTGQNWHMYRIELYNEQEFDFASDDYWYVIDSKGYEGAEDIGLEFLNQYYDWCEKYFPEYNSDN